MKKLLLKKTYPSNFRIMSKIDLLSLNESVCPFCGEVQENRSVCGILNIHPIKTDNGQALTSIFLSPR